MTVVRAADRALVRLVAVADLVATVRLEQTLRRRPMD
jgi:hypothetical protein